MTDKSDLQHVKVTNRVVGLAAIVLLFVAAPSKAVWLDFAETANEKRNAISHAVYEIVINPALNLLDDGLSPGTDSRTFQEQAEQLLGRTKRKLDKAADKAVREELKAIANMIGFRKAGSFGSRLQAKVVNRATGFVKSKVLDAAATVTDKLVSGEREGGRLAGGHERGHGSIDMRIALAVDDDEREWYESKARVLGKTPLPAARFPRTRQASDPVPGTLVDAWDVDAGWSERSPQAGVSAADGDPWGQDPKGEWDSPPAASAATKTDVWGDETEAREHTRRAGASVARTDPWDQDAGQEWDSPAGTPVAGDVGDEPADTEWRNEYAAALNHFLGPDDDDNSYEAALRTVERLELEAVRRHKERERQARLEAEERERRARLAEERRERRARESAEATQGAIVSGILSGLAIAQGQLDMTQQHIALAQQLEDQRRRAAADRRQRLAALRQEQEQQRQAEEARYRQQQEQMRRQAEEQERQQREAERRRVAEQERQRQIAEEQRKEAERQAKLMRRQACLQRISGSRNGCVQPIRERGGSDWYHYYFRNNCNYPISVYYGGRGDRRLSSLAMVPPRSKSHYMKPKGRLRYSACYDDPGVSGPSCEIMSWACPD